ncbi:hypothetical protein [Ramlibacter tataouinensis]|uniref:Uncharacterized protein n=1 Tax=Ramlibacter tataouinensis (strain ATCC BAA-407 / DSM 14655 / LMG 21543 / TTB310) TaxID=365046 RepID=F5Y6J6_RAMTT|nr:hypothetical protein [Ramlibacter tataouinensis]AEG94070.1 hypothetical protein Rta_29660 [Ramlibacter tataouinensis TTB310]
MSSPTYPARAVSHASAHPHAQPGHTQQPPRPGEQAAQYKGAMIRTSLAMGKPSGMARAMMGKLKSAPKPPSLPDVRVHAAAGESVQVAAVDDEWDDGRRLRFAGSGGDGGGGVGGFGGGTQGGGGGGASGQGDKDSPPEGDDGAGTPVGRRRARLRAIGQAGALGGGRSRRIYAMAALHASWADVAMDEGGLPALRSALVDRLMLAARGSDRIEWRKDWMGDVAAAYAARYDRRQPLGLAGDQAWPSAAALLIERSKALPAVRLPPHRARETMFCLLWLVVHGLARPRTPSQVRAMMVRLAVLVRVSEGGGYPRPATKLENDEDPT